MIFEKLLYIPFFVAFFATTLWAMPALDKTWKAKQPDGSTIEVRKFGNEHFHFTGTPDGYPIHKDSRGYFRYIDKNGKLSNQKPKNKDDIIRSLKQKHLAKSKNSAPMMAPSATNASSSESMSTPQMLPAVSKTISGEKNALVILVQFNDLPFSFEDPKASFDSLLNMEGYNKHKQSGSAKDYFVQNSMGKFKPHFDIVGPVTISGNYHKDYGYLSQNGNYGAQLALQAALDTLIRLGTVDFSKYDNDGDRYLDFVHMIYAGFGAHDSDQDSAIWPHKWIFQYRKAVAQNAQRRSIYVSSYACSAELDGYSYNINPNNKIIAGVGNFLHEFSHLMGLPDLYATGSTPQATPSSWSIMDNGAYNSNNYYGPLATSPPYYSAFERMSLGWMDATDLYVNGSVSITGIENNVALRLTNPSNNDEFYLLEYRTQKDWDQALPNHGMLIWHIDYNKMAWDSAKVNSTEHQHVDLIEADNDTSLYTLNGNSFPGKSRVTEFSQFSLWDGTTLPVALSNITEASDKTYVSFNVAMNAPDGTLELTEEPESSSSEESSSSMIEEISSSSEAESSCSEESSSSEEKSSSSEETLVIASPLDISIGIVNKKGHIFLYDLPQGEKTVTLFSLNGNILFRQKVTGSSFDFATDNITNAAILLVTEGRRSLYSGKIR